MKFLGLLLLNFRFNSSSWLGPKKCNASWNIDQFYFMLSYNIAKKGCFIITSERNLQSLPLLDKSGFLSL